jgi:uncharacterized protein YndB with AHSA1/START domain
MANVNDDIKNRTLGTTRIFNAPLEIVWKVWSDTNHLNNWWGPRGFTQTTFKHEFKENGTWAFVMHGPNGVDYQNDMVYGEIIPMKKIVIHHNFHPKFSITATFTVIDSKRTQVDFISIIDDQKVCDSVKDYAIIGNVEHQMKFETEIAKVTGEIVPIEFVITREFKTDLNSMWKMWTEPSQMVRWLVPKVISAGKCEMDFQRGGFYHYSMISPDGNTSWGKNYYIDIVKNVRLIYVTTFSNANGEITRHPLASEWPTELLTTINFEAISENSTKIEIRWYPINAEPNEIKCFNDAHAGMTMGWSGSLDQLQNIKA